MRRLMRSTDSYEDLTSLQQTKIKFHKKFHIDITRVLISSAIKSIFRVTRPTGEGSTRIYNRQKNISEFLICNLSHLDSINKLFRLNLYFLNNLKFIRLSPRIYYHSPFITLKSVSFYINLSPVYKPTILAMKIIQIIGLGAALAFQLTSAHSLSDE